MITPLRRSVSRAPSGYDEIRRFIVDKLPAESASAEEIAAATAATARAISDSGLGEIRLIVTLREDRLEVEVRPVQPGSKPGSVPPAEGSFAAWLLGHLTARRLSHEAAARLIGVSVKTVSRWARGETEPRMRDLRRLDDAFGELPPFGTRAPQLR
jgi:hypothetical protein